jgi:hypothetical protein
MRREKRGLIFRADNRYPWMAHHACVRGRVERSDHVCGIRERLRMGERQYHVPSLQISRRGECVPCVLKAQTGLVLPSSPLDEPHLI